MMFLPIALRVIGSLPHISHAPVNGHRDTKISLLCHHWNIWDRYLATLSYTAFLLLLLVGIHLTALRLVKAYKPTIKVRDPTR